MAQIPDNLVVLTKEAYSDLCLKAAVVEGVRKDLNDIRAEIEECMDGSNDLLYDRGIVDCLDIIDRHLKGESK